MLLPFFIIVFSIFSEKSQSWTAPLINPSNTNFLTGITTLISASDPSLSDGFQNYQFSLANVLPNNSVKAALGIIGQQMTLIPPSMDYNIFIVSVSNLTMNIRVTMISATNPLEMLKICYMVTSYFSLKIYYKVHTFAATDQVMDSMNLTFRQCPNKVNNVTWAHCRKSPINLPYAPLGNNYKAIAVISGFMITSFQPITDPPQISAFGFGMAAQTATATGIYVDVYVYGRGLLTSISAYYMSYEQQTLNIYGDKKIIANDMSVGCSFGWGSVCYQWDSSIINSTLTTADTGFGVYYSTNYFLGFSNFIGEYDGTSNYGMDFDVGPTTANGNTYRSLFTYYGYPDAPFRMTFQYLILLDFYCPDSGTPDIYYTYNSNGCNNTCNNWVEQYADGDRKCQKCGPLCFKCSGTADMCDECYTSQRRILSGDRCVCKTIGFYDDNISHTCPACHYSCKSCWGPSASQCYSCSSTSRRTIEINTCFCDPRHYDNSPNEVCGNCHYTCYTCSENTATNCLTCSVSDFREPIAANNSCGCMTGYFDRGVPHSVCGICHYTCLRCAGGSGKDKCTACDLNIQYRELINGACPCIQGYYDNLNPICVLCHVTCKTCDGPTSNACTGCDNTKFRGLQSGQCKCIAKYYPFNLTCQPCHYTCFNCTGPTMYECENCNDVITFRKFNGTDSSCFCIAGYTEPPLQQPQCTQCHRSCLTCSGSDTSCITCDPLKFRQLAGASCLCLFGYIDMDQPSGICQKCHYSCLTCSGKQKTQCSSCDIAWRTLYGGQCQCNTGTFDRSPHPQCFPCHQECLECQDQYKTSCLDCEPLYLREIVGATPKPCTCISRYFQNGNTPLCSACHFSCLRCSVNSTNCISCDSTTDHRFPSANNCLCQLHYYEVNAQSCAQCFITCQNCSINPNNCTSCQTTRRYLSGNKCLCNHGTFEDPSDPFFTCLSCFYSCRTCENSSSTCLSCPMFSFRSLNNAACPCNFGYYENNVPICARCPYQCDGCTGPDPPQCIACPVSSMRTLQADKQCPCDPGYYDDSSSPICKLCQNICATCTAFSVCSSCFPISTQFRTLSSGSCRCIAGYYENPANPVCQTCHYSCNTCSGPLETNCFICKTNRAFQVGSSTCPCSPGHYEAAQLCYACDITCRTCFNTATNCTGCDLLTRYLLGNKCFCRDGYFQNGATCTACDQTCGACTLSPTNCLTCNPTHFTVLEGSSCVCIPGQYKDSLTLTCNPCGQKCGTCFGLGQSQCLSCKPLTFRTFNSLNNRCECNPGYIETGISVCSSCHSICMTCYGVTETNCLSCYPGAIKIGSTCKVQVYCSTGYYFEEFCVTTCPNSTFPSGNICQNCINNCKTCKSASLCTTCVEGFYLNSQNQTCSVNCPQGSYINHITRECDFCPPGCQICIQRNNTVVCPKCYSGYFLFNHTSCVESSFCVTPNYVIVGLKCFGCQHPCETCNRIASNGCLSCKDGFSLHNGQCLSICPNGFYSLNKVCLICQERCQQCSATKCELCKKGFYLTPQEINPRCIPNGFFFDSSTNQQSTCHPNCKSCTNSSFSSCISCAKFRGNDAQMAISGYCKCWEESIDIGNGQCSFDEFQTVQRYIKVMKSSTDTAFYTGAVASVFSGNFIPSVVFMLYQQSYSTLYFINATALMQTDHYLEQALERNLNFYMNRKLTQKNSEIMKPSRLLVTLQDDMSLFSRGNEFEVYLFNWAIYTVMVITGMWLMVLIVNLGLQSRCITESQVFCTVLKRLKHLLQEPAIILVHLLTVSEVSLYAAASFKYILVHSASLSIDWVRLSLSLALALYYIAYLVRLTKGCYQIGRKMDPICKNPFNPLKLLILSFSDYREPTQGKQYRENEAPTSFANIPLQKKLYIPLLMTRMALSSILIVQFSSKPTLQIGSIIGILFIWTLYSLICCPYSKFFKIFIHLNEVVYLTQVGMITHSVMTPDGEKLLPSYVQLGLNGVQIISMIVFSLLMALKMVYGICKEETATANKVGNSYFSENNVSEIVMDFKIDTRFRTNQHLGQFGLNQFDTLDINEDEQEDNITITGQNQTTKIIPYKFSYQQFSQSNHQPILPNEDQFQNLQLKAYKSHVNNHHKISFDQSGQLEPQPYKNVFDQKLVEGKSEQSCSSIEKKPQLNQQMQQGKEEEDLIIRKKYRAVRKIQQ